MEAGSLGFLEVVVTGGARPRGGEGAGDIGNGRGGREAQIGGGTGGEKRAGSEGRGYKVDYLTQYRDRA